MNTMIDTAISKRVAAGMVDPHEIARDIIAETDKHWLCKALTEHAEFFVATYAKEGIRKNRTTITPPRPHETRAPCWWVSDEVGWKLEADLTVSDLDEMIAYTRRVIESYRGRDATLCEWRAALAASGCGTLGEMRTVVAA